MKETDKPAPGLQAGDEETEKPSPGPGDSASNEIKGIELGKLVADANALIAADETVRSGVAALITARQLYATALKSLERHISGLEHQLHPAVLDVYLESVSAQAAKPFKMIDMFEALTQSTVPWVQKVIASDIEQDAKDRKAAAIEREQKRRETPLPLPFVFATKPDAALLNRKKPLVLHGPLSAVQYLLNKTVFLNLPDDNSAVKPVNIVWFSTTKQVVSSLRLAVVSDWMFNVGTKAQFDNKMAELMQTVVGPAFRQVGGPPDLLVIDDIRLFLRPCKPSELPWKTATAVRWLWAWVNAWGCAVLAGCPTPQPLDSVSELEKYADTTAVSYELGAVDSKILIEGGHVTLEVKTAEMPKPASKIIGA